jgi:PAS domain S-box-containing protein
MERHRRLVESSPDGILIVEDERVTFVNPAAVHLFGVNDANQLLGRSLADLFATESHASVREHLLRRQPSETVQSWDVMIVRPDGTVRDISLTGARMDEDGERTVQVIARDITQQKDAERALRESEERLALAVAGAQEGVWDWNLETNAVVYSTRWKQMLGYSDEEIEPHVSAWERLAHPDDKARADRANESVARGERSTYEAEFRLRHKDGHYVHVLSRGFPVRREPGGPVVRIVCTHLDLTERKRAEASLRENEERLKLAFAGAQEGVWDWNLETGAVVYSSRWKDMLGYADDEIEPQIGAWERLLHPEDMERARQVNESVAQGASTYEGEFRLRHKDGHYVQVLSRGYTVRRNLGGTIVGSSETLRSHRTETGGGRTDTH